LSAADAAYLIPVPEPELTPDELIARAVAMRPMLRERQAETEERTFYGEDVHERFKEAGFYRTLQPRKFGGYEFGVDVFYRLVTELARGCPSTGWCFTLGSSHVLNVASFYEESAQAEMFGPDGHFVCASRGTSGTAERVDGGWLVKGKWDYLSGSPYSTHIHIAVDLPEDEFGEDAIGMAVIPADQYTRLDDWRGMLGMKGSGSHSVVVDGAVIPEGWVTTTYLGAVEVEQTIGGQIHNNSMYAAPVFAVLTATLTSIAHGIVRAALDDYAEGMHTKTMKMPPYELRAHNPELQQVYGRALSVTDAAEAVILRASSLYHQYAQEGFEGGERFSAEKDLRIAAMLVQGSQLLVQAMDDLMRTAGSTAARDGTRMQRYWRDMTVFRGHVGNLAWERWAKQNGAWQLGIHDDLGTSGF